MKIIYKCSDKADKTMERILLSLLFSLEGIVADPSKISKHYVSQPRLYAALSQNLRNCILEIQMNK